MKSPNAVYQELNVSPSASLIIATTAVLAHRKMQTKNNDVVKLCQPTISASAAVDMNGLDYSAYICGYVHTRSMSAA